MAFGGILHPPCPKGEWDIGNHTRMHIDFSAHNTWDTCAAKWYELYIHNRRRRWPKALRDDALCLGSLVHEGLRVWQQTRTVEIPAAVQEECTPTRDCLSLAEELVYGYATHYPEERWPLIVCEEPCLFPLVYQKGLKSPDIELTGLAKIDAYFYVPEVTTIESGFGIEYTLNPGWWIHEYKTKSPYVSLPLYMQGWEMGMQASYQMLALQHKLLNEMEYRDFQMHNGVQGILVNVIEKPRRSIPKRTCRSCKEISEMNTWIPTGTGEYSCPLCGNRQKLTPLKENPVLIPPAYYRIAVSRTMEELSRAKAEMIQVGERMIAMEAGGKMSEPWRKSSCVDFQYKRPCDYFGACKNGEDTRTNDQDYFSPVDYRGLVVIGETA